MTNEDAIKLDEYVTRLEQAVNRMRNCFGEEISDVKVRDLCNLGIVAEYYSEAIRRMCSPDYP